MHRTTQRKDQGLESRHSPRGWSPVPALLSLFGATSVRFSLSEAQSLTRPWRVISSRRDESSVRRGQAESGACKGPESPAAASAPSRRG